MMKFKDWHSRVEQDEQFVEELNEVLITTHHIKGIVRTFLRHEERIRSMIGRMSGPNRQVVSLIFTALVAIMKELRKQGKI